MRCILLLLLIIAAVPAVAVDESGDPAPGDVLIWADDLYPLWAAVSTYARHMGVHAVFEDIEDATTIPSRHSSMTLGIRLDGAPLETMLEQFRMAIRAHWPGRRIAIAMPSGRIWTEGAPKRLAQMAPPRVADEWQDVIQVVEKSLAAEGRSCISLTMFRSSPDRMLWTQTAGAATSLEEALLLYAHQHEQDVVRVWYLLPLNNANWVAKGQVRYQFDGISTRALDKIATRGQAHMLFTVMSGHPLARATLAAAAASPPQQRVGFYEYALPALPPREQRGRKVKNIYFHPDGSVDEWSVMRFEIFSPFTGSNDWLHTVATDRRMRDQDDNVRCGFLASYINIGDRPSLWEEELTRDEQGDVRTVDDCVRLAIAVGARRGLTVQSVVPDALLQHALRPADPDSRTLADLFRARMPPEATGLWHLIQTRDGDTRDLGHWPVPEGVELFEAPNEDLLTEP